MKWHDLNRDQQRALLEHFVDGQMFPTPVPHILLRSETAPIIVILPALDRFIVAGQVDGPADALLSMTAESAGYRVELTPFGVRTLKTLRETTHA